MVAQVAGRLDSLPREEAVDGVLVDAENSPDADRVETAVVDQASNRLRVDTQLPRDFADAVQAVGLGVDGRHGRAKLYTDRPAAP